MNYNKSVVAFAEIKKRLADCSHLDVYQLLMDWFDSLCVIV